MEDERQDHKDSWVLLGIQSDRIRRVLLIGESIHEEVKVEDIGSEVVTITV
jgi:hypothetical protein